MSHFSDKNDNRRIRKKRKMEEKNTNFKNIRHIIVVYLTIAVATIVSMIIIYTQILINAYIPSESMENTLMTGDRVIGNRLAYKLGKDPKRFDIVMFYAPDDPSTIYIKRVIGLPGEHVTIKNGKVYINDSKEPLDDSFIPEDMETTGDKTYLVPANCYFMLGDNRNDSLDSRYCDNPYVSEDMIIAKAIFKYWKGFALVK